MFQPGTWVQTHPGRVQAEGRPPGGMRGQSDTGSAAGLRPPHPGPLSRRRDGASGLRLVSVLGG